MRRETHTKNVQELSRSNLREVSRFYSSVYPNFPPFKTGIEKEFFEKLTKSKDYFAGLTLVHDGEIAELLITTRNGRNKVLFYDYMISGKFTGLQAFISPKKRMSFFLDHIQKASIRKIEAVADGENTGGRKISEFMGFYETVYPETGRVFFENYFVPSLAVAGVLVRAATGMHREMSLKEYAIALRAFRSSLARQGAHVQFRIARSGMKFSFTVQKAAEAFCSVECKSLCKTSIQSNTPEAVKGESVEIRVSHLNLSEVNQSCKLTLIDQSKDKILLRREALLGPGQALRVSRKIRHNQTGLKRFIAALDVNGVQFQVESAVEVIPAFDVELSPDQFLIKENQWSKMPIKITSNVKKQGLRFFMESENSCLLKNAPGRDGKPLRNTLKIPVELKLTGKSPASAELVIKDKEDNNKILFGKKIHFAITKDTVSGCVANQNESHIHLCTDRLVVIINKRTGGIVAKVPGKKAYVFQYPEEICPPFSQMLPILLEDGEFGLPTFRWRNDQVNRGYWLKTPLSGRIYNSARKATAVVSWADTDIPGIRMNKTVSLHPEGLIQVKTCITNRGEKNLKVSVQIKTCLSPLAFKAFAFSNGRKRSIQKITSWNDYYPMMCKLEKSGTLENSWTAYDMGEFVAGMVWDNSFTLDAIPMGLHSWKMPWLTVQVPELQLSESFRISPYYLYVGEGDCAEVQDLYHSLSTHPL